VAARDPIARLTSIAGAAVGAVGLVYVVGALSLSLRYEGFGLPGQQTAAVTPREVLLAAGLRTLVVWIGLGVAVVLVLTAREQRLARAIQRRLRTPSGLVAVAVLVLALLFVRVLWPLAVVLAILVTTYATVTWDAVSARRPVVIALAIAVVAVVYEADRITFLVESTCVNVKEPAARACGLLVGQQDRGFYLGVSEGPGVARLVFVPAERVSSSSTRKQKARVAERYSRSRRKSVIARLPGIRVR
jgi:hypothetical protein